MLNCEHCGQPTSGRLGNVAICAKCFAARAKLTKKKNAAYTNALYWRLRLLKVRRRGSEYWGQIDVLASRLETAESEYDAACQKLRTQHRHETKFY